MLVPRTLFKEVPGSTCKDQALRAGSASTCTKSKMAMINFTKESMPRGSRVISRVERGSTDDLDQPRGQILHLNGYSCGCAQPHSVNSVVLLV